MNLPRRAVLTVTEVGMGLGQLCEPKLAPERKTDLEVRQFPVSCFQVKNERRRSTRLLLMFLKQDTKLLRVSSSRLRLNRAAPRCECEWVYECEAAVGNEHSLW